MLTVAQIKRRKTTLGGFLAPLCFFNRIKLHFRISLHPIVTEIYQPFLLIWNFRNVTQIEKTNIFLLHKCTLVMFVCFSWHLTKLDTHTQKCVEDNTQFLFSKKASLQTALKKFLELLCNFQLIQSRRSYWNCYLERNGANQRRKGGKRRERVTETGEFWSVMKEKSERGRSSFRFNRVEGPAEEVVCVCQCVWI